MAKAGDSYQVELKAPHLGWGTYRHTDSRPPREHEAYIPIPADKAYVFHLLNSNGTNGSDVLGENLFNCVSADGTFSGILRAQGNQSDERYAKQFSVDKDLQAVGEWYERIGAQAGDTIKVSWTSEVDIVVEKL